MINQLERLQSRYTELEGLLTAPATLANPKLLREYGQEQSRLDKPVSLYRDLRRLDEELEGARSVLAESDDPEAIRAGERRDRGVGRAGGAVDARLAAGFAPPRSQRRAGRHCRDQGPARVARRQRCSLPNSTACTSALPSASVGR